MPNIEIYGFENRSQCSKTVELIRETLWELGLARDAVDTVINSSVETCDCGYPAQYIRVLSTKFEEIEQIIEALKKKNLGLDTEKPFRLLKFYDSKEMESETGHAERVWLIETLLNRQNPIQADMPRELRAAQAGWDKMPLGILRELVG